MVLRRLVIHAFDLALPELRWDEDFEVPDAYNILGFIEDGIFLKYFQNGKAPS